MLAVVSADAQVLSVGREFGVKRSGRERSQSIVHSPGRQRFHRQAVCALADDRYTVPRGGVGGGEVVGGGANSWGRGHGVLRVLTKKGRGRSPISPVLYHCVWPFLVEMINSVNPAKWVWGVGGPSGG